MYEINSLLVKFPVSKLQVTELTQIRFFCRTFSAFHSKIHSYYILATRHMKNTVVGGVITLNDIICKPATTHGQREVKIE